MGQPVKPLTHLQQLEAEEYPDFPRSRGRI